MTIITHSNTQILSSLLLQTKLLSTVFGSKNNIQVYKEGKFINSGSRSNCHHSVNCSLKVKIANLTMAENLPRTIKTISKSYLHPNQKWPLKCTCMTDWKKERNVIKIYVPAHFSRPSKLDIWLYEIFVQFLALIHSLLCQILHHSTKEIKHV